MRLLTLASLVVLILGSAQAQHAPEPYTNLFLPGDSVITNFKCDNGMDASACYFADTSFEDFHALMPLYLMDRGVRLHGDWESHEDIEGAHMLVFSFSGSAHQLTAVEAESGVVIFVITPVE